MKLSTGVIHSLFMIFSQELDGYDDIALDAQGRQKVVRRMFELGSVRLDIAVNANRLKPIVQSFEEANNALIKQLSGGNDEIKQTESPVEFAKYQAELKEMAATQHEVDLKPISKAALKLDINPIPVRSLMILESSGLLLD